MAEELIDSYVDRNGIKGDTDYIVASLREVYAEFKKLEAIKVDLKGATGLAQIIPAMQQGKAGMDSLTVAVEAVGKQMAITNGTTKELYQNTILYTKAQKESAQAAIAQAKAAAETAKAKQAEAKASEQSAKAKEREAKLLDQAVDDYLQLSKAYNEAALKAKNYVLRLGEGHPIAVQAVKDANDLGNVLKKLDASVGQNQRNVGNYASAFNGLGFSFAQVSRELPSLSVSFQQFALAISNNLPMVADELGKAKREIAALKAEGKEAPSIFSKIGSALFSWQVGLSVGITLFTLYSKQIVNFFSNLVNGSNVFNDAAFKLKAYNEAIEESKQAYADAVKQVSELRQVLQLAKEGFVDKENAVKLYNETIGKTTGEVKSLDEAERALEKNANAYIQFTLLKAAANVALGKAAAKAVEIQIDAMSRGADENTDLRRKAFENATKKEIDDYNKIRDEANDAFLKGDQKRADELNAKADAIFQQRVEAGFKVNEKKQQASLQKIAEDFNKAAAEIAKQFKFDFFGRNDKDTDDSAKKAKEEADKRLQLQNEISNLQLQRFADFSKELSEKEDAAIGVRLQALQNYLSAQQDIINNNANTERLLGQKTTIELEKIEADRKDKLIRIQVEYLNARLNIIKQFNKKQAEEELKLQKIIEKAIEDRFKKDFDSLEKLKKKNADTGKEIYDNEKALADKRKELYQNLVSELSNLTFTLFTSGIEREKNEIQNQIDLLEAKKQKEIEVANQTIANTEERAAAIAVIEARANAQREQLQKRQRDLDFKKAQFDKAQSIARIVQETAKGIISAVAALQPQLIPLIAAIGAAQLATVIAQPIPRYKHGKNVNDLYEGPAIVGDGGKPEAIVRENGQVEITPDKPTLAYVKSRDIVLPDANMLSDLVVSGKMGGRLIERQVVMENDKVESAIKDMKQEVVSAIKKIPQPVIKVQNMLSRRVLYGDSSNEYLNKNLQA